MLLAGSTPAVVSRGPQTFRPLKILFARPSQKLRKLKTALIVVGVLRGSDCRTLVRPTAKTEVWLRQFSPFLFLVNSPTKSRWNTPWDETTSSVSESRVDSRLFRSESR